MKCEACLELLSGYMDGMLEPKELVQVEQHLRRCGPCAADLEQLRATVALLSTLDEVPVPASFHARLHSRLMQVAAESHSAGKVQRLPVRKLFKWAAPVATAAAAAIVLVSSLNNPGPVSPIAANTPQTNVSMQSTDTSGATQGLQQDSSSTQMQTPPVDGVPSNTATGQTGSGKSSGTPVDKAPPQSGVTSSQQGQATSGQPDQSTASGQDSGDAGATSKSGTPDTITAPPSTGTVRTASVQPDTGPSAAGSVRDIIAVTFKAGGNAESALQQVRLLAAQFGADLTGVQAQVTRDGGRQLAVFVPDATKAQAFIQALKQKLTYVGEQPIMLGSGINTSQTGTTQEENPSVQTNPTEQMNPLRGVEVRVNLLP